jgi:hypothetical protein
MTKSKRVLTVGALLVALAGIGGYAWFDYERAESALSAARVKLQSIETALHRDRNIDKAEANYTLARIEVEALERSHATWVSRGAIEALRKDLSAYKMEIDGLQKPSPR